MEKQGARISPGRISAERRKRISQALSLSPDSDLARLRPELLGEGRFRAVFELKRRDYEISEKLVGKEKDRGVLVKVDKGATEVALRNILKTGDPDISREMRGVFSQRLVSERFARKSFDTIFGGIALPEKVFLRKIPLSRTVIGEFFPDIVLPETFPSSCEVTTLVYVQKRAPAAAFHASSHDVLFRCAEQIPVFSDAVFFYANQTFIDLYASWHDIRQLAGISPEIVHIIRLAEGEAQLRTLFQDFLARSLKYTEQTGEILDLFGSDNARLYKDASGNWRLLLLDGYTRGRAFALAREALRAAGLGYGITENEALAVVSSLNYVRNMNALALAVNAPTRFRLSRSDIAPVAQKLIPVMRKILSGG